MKKDKYQIKGYDIGFFKECNLYYNKEYEDLISFKDAKDINLKDIENCDVLIHLAGISNDPLNKLTSENVYDPTRHYTLEIANKCKSLNKRFIFASSCSDYGAAMTEKFLTEESETNPQTGYSLNKLVIEKDLEKIADKNFFPICLRFATIFGVSSRIRFDVVINMLVAMAITKGEIRLNSNGEAWRPNLFIEDACASILHFIEYKKKKSDNKILIVNIGRNDNNLKIIDIANIIKSLVKGSNINFLENTRQTLGTNLFSDRKIKDGKDSRTYKVSFDKSEKQFGFRCKFSVKTGIVRMIKDLKQIKFDYEKFKFIGFYRLQYLESLYEKKLIDGYLKWRI
jgi:nucleoside-diphosphate-sugar epimerase